MSNIPVNNVSPINRPSSGRPSPSSSIYNGGSFEIITGSSSTSSRAPLDFSYLNPLNNGQPGSMTDVTLEEALERVQDLMKENHELREYLKENNEMMKQQYRSLMEWKEKINQTNSFNSKKFEETRKLVESLQKENAEMKKKLEEAKTNTDQNEKFKELEKRNKSLEKNLSDKNGVIENLQEQLQNLQVQVNTGEKLETPNTSLDEKFETMLMIEKGKEVGESLSQTIRIQQLENQVRQFRESNDQLLQDLENAQKLKEQFQKENASLCNQNIELNQKLERTMTDLRSSNPENKTIKQSLHDTEDGKVVHGDESLSKLGFSFVAGKTVDENPNREEERLQMQSRSSRSSESDVSLTDIKMNVTSSQEFVNLQQRFQEQENLVQKLKLEIQQKDQVIEQKVQQIEQQNKEESFAYTSDLQSLRSQVVSLLNEVTESQNKIDAASKTIEKKNTRIAELEDALTRMQEQMKQTQEDVTVIETLRLSINNYQEAVNAERREHQTTKKQLAELRQSFNQLVADYKGLNDELTRCKEKEVKSHMENDNKRFLDEIGRLTAQTLAAEETIKYRDDQLRDLQRENHNLRDNIQKLKEEADKVPILKAQAEVWKVDFDTERAARERQHTEKEKLLSEMHNLHVQNQQLLDELETYSKGQFAEMQRRHAPGGGTHQQMLQGYLQVGGGGGGPQPIRYPYPQQHYPHSPPGNQAQGYDNQPHQAAAGQQQRQAASQHEEGEYQPLSCPKCDLQCPDVDTLQIHVLDCIDQPDINN